jgi:hypothetical protein
MSKKETLPIISAKTVAAKALAIVKEERSGKQLGLITRFPALNKSAGKFMRFGETNLFAGLSGHGKSYLVNTLNEDFTNEELNGNCEYDPLILNFSLEMLGETEALRSCASDFGVSYGYLLSSKFNNEVNDYNTITDAELLKIEKYLEFYSNKRILFVENSSHMQVLFNTIEKVYIRYIKDKPKARLIVNFDHSLLIEKLDERDVLTLMSNLAKLCIKCKTQFGSMNNIIGQLNNKIEEILRILKPELHYPQKSDIYAQAQLYNACENVYVIHQPILLKIAL